MLNIPAAETLRALEMCRPCISDDRTRFYLGGINIMQGKEGIEFCAADGHRLQLVTIPGTLPGGKRRIISRESVDSLVAALRKLKHRIHVYELKIDTASDTEWSTNVAGETVPLKLIDATFPDYWRIIPSGGEKSVIIYEKSVIIPGEQFRQGWKAMYAFCHATANSKRAGGYAVKCTIENKTLTLSQSYEHGNAEWRLPLEEPVSEPFVIGFQSRYVHEWAKLINGGVKIQYASPTSPIMFTEVGDSTAIFVMMPVRM